jgi:hypothetical protein
VATPNKFQNNTLSLILAQSLCPDTAGDLWIFDHVEYILNRTDVDQVEKLVLYLIDKSSSYFQCYVVDKNGNHERRNTNV